MDSAATPIEPVRFIWIAPLLLLAGALASASAGIAIEGVFGGDARIHGAEFWADRAPFDFTIFLIAAFGLAVVVTIAGGLDKHPATPRRLAALTSIHIATAFGIPGAWLLFVAIQWLGDMTRTELIEAVLGLGALSAVLNLPCTVALYWAIRLRR